MIKTLRKRHLQIWSTMAFLLPLGIICGWLVIPRGQNIKIMEAHNVMALPVLFKTVDKENYSAAIRTDEAKKQWQLTFKNKVVLMVPSAVIYKTNGDTKDITNNELVGRIESTGDYYFRLKAETLLQPSRRFILYDFIHDQIIDSIDFK